MKRGYAAESVTLGMLPCHWCIQLRQSPWRVFGASFVAPAHAADCTAPSVAAGRQTRLAHPQVVSATGSFPAGAVA